jgi:excinuclease ABC subunit A
LKEFEGVIGNLERRYKESESAFVKEEVQTRFMRSHLCPECHGARLKPEALAVTVGKKSIAEITHFSIREAQTFFNQLTLSEKARFVARQILKRNPVPSEFSGGRGVGLRDAWTGNPPPSLGGKPRRIHLATQIGSGLVGVLYVLDEPTIGLHPRDNERLLTTLRRLRDIGNTLVVVEHDAETILAADWVIDLGPGAGVHGGEIVSEGPVSER